MDVFYCISYIVEANDTDQSTPCIHLNEECTDNTGWCCPDQGLECKAKDDDNDDDGKLYCLGTSTEDYNSSIFSDVINIACAHEKDPCQDGAREGDQSHCCPDYSCVKNEKGNLECHNEGSGDLLRSLIFDQ